MAKIIVRIDPKAVPTKECQSTDPCVLLQGLQLANLVIICNHLKSRFHLTYSTSLATPVGNFEVVARIMRDWLGHVRTANSGNNQPQLESTLCCIPKSLYVKYAAEGKLLADS